MSDPRRNVGLLLLAAFAAFGAGVAAVVVAVVLAASTL